MLSPFLLNAKPTQCRCRKTPHSTTHCDDSSSKVVGKVHSFADLTATHSKEESAIYPTSSALWQRNINNSSSTKCESTMHMADYNKNLNKNDCQHSKTRPKHLKGSKEHIYKTRQKQQIFEVFFIIFDRLTVV